MAAWVVSAGYVRLHADPRLQRRRGKAIARIRSKRPRPDTLRTETTELPDPFIVQIPIRLIRRRWTGESRSQRVPCFRRGSAIVCEGFSVQPQVVAIERHSTLPRTRRVHTPER